MASPIRTARIADTIQKQLSLLLYQKVSDPRFSKAHITDVEVSHDLSHAKVYVQIDGDEKESVLAALNKARGFFKKELAPLIQMRLMPGLQFYIDHSQEQYQKIESILAEEKANYVPDDDDQA